ncbi:STAS domain-containing protein [Amycolatopsis rubida]|uniref:Anti-sigma factor antagonist n=1 Tax=Amycolatopsis rubida TaxID=112413 RepID=A0A1I5RU48_9PSEU|nr:MULTISPECIES: STAS domain-containing protein [Amycolatopsis]MYW89388.1 anti-sigma factor antagonist [Amycolatopsis rubida]NEC54365.1 STAS domain-containing protein [Amycolatopsis rubida]OAP21375.1 Anti-sigma-F factor antagonist RsfB [Amycolatopsis sp. M39]SFP62054.1 anti-anti-sigma factor [Amycolatopsis rubida]
MDEPTDPSADPAREFRVEREDRPPVAVLTVHGEVDLVTAPLLTAAVDEALDGAPPVLVLDLAAVEFLASAGLTALVTLTEHRARGASLRIVASGRATMRPIQLTGLEQTLPLYPTVEAALAGS